MPAKKLSAVRDCLVATARQIGRTGASTAEIISAFRESYPNVTDGVRQELEDMALTQMLNAAKVRRSHINDNNQQNLFATFKAPIQIVLKDNEGKHIHKNLEDCSLKELDEYIESLPLRQVVSSRKSVLLRLRQTVGRFQDAEHDSVGKCWQAYLATKPDE